MQYLLTIFFGGVLLVTGIYNEYSFVYTAIIFLIQTFLFYISWFVLYFVYRSSNRYKAEGFIVNEGHGLRREIFWVFGTLILLGLMSSHLYTVIAPNLLNTQLWLLALLASSGYLLVCFNAIINVKQRYLSSSLLIMKYQGLERLLLIMFWLTIVYTTVEEAVKDSEFYFVISVLALTCIDLLLVKMSRGNSKLYYALEYYEDTFFDSGWNLRSSVNRYVDLDEYYAKQNTQNLK